MDMEIILRNIELDIEALKARLEEPPVIEAIVEAKALLDMYPREILPDWVEILANGNPEMLPAVYETAIADMQTDEVGNADDV